MAENSYFSANITITIENITFIASNHPYHLHASDAPGMTLVNNLFNGRVYQGWKRSVLIALSTKKEIEFITGFQSFPPIGTIDLQLWSRCNDMDVWSDPDYLILYQRK